MNYSNLFWNIIIDGTNLLIEIWLDRRERYIALSALAKVHRLTVLYRISHPQDVCLNAFLYLVISVLLQVRVSIRIVIFSLNYPWHFSSTFPRCYKSTGEIIDFTTLAFFFTLFSEQILSKIRSGWNILEAILF